MISELDQQLLDEYLDGQLAPVDAQRLARRLALEVPLAEELMALRAERTIRQSVFAALEPEPKIAEAFSKRVASAARRQTQRRRFGGVARIGGGIAACIAIGFAAGWIGRGHGSTPIPTPNTPIAQSGSPGSAPAVAVLNSAHPAAPTGQLTGPFQVSLTDPDGHVLAVQKFDRIEDAAAAADTMGRRIQSGNDANEAQAQTVVYADHF
jgi:anti-sigma factor RsiW